MDQRNQTARAWGAKISTISKLLLVALLAIILHMAYLAAHIGNLAVIAASVSGDGNLVEIFPHGQLSLGASRAWIQKEAAAGTVLLILFGLSMLTKPQTRRW